MSAQPEFDFNIESEEAEKPELTLTVDNTGSLAMSQAVEIIPGFTANESETLHLLSQNKTNSEVAKAAGLNVTAAQVRASRLKGKLFAENREQLVRHAEAIVAWQESEPGQNNETVENEELTVQEMAEIWERLTPKERETVMLLVDLSPDEIAQQRGVLPGTIYSQLCGINSKLGQSNSKNTKKWLKLNMLGEATSPMDSLTEVELGTFKLMAQGRKVVEIARQQSLHQTTVSGHKRRIFEKLGISCVKEAQSIAYEHGLIDSPPLATDEPTSDIEENSERGKDILATLTPKELDVLGLLTLGLSNREIALQMNVEEGTAKFHVGNIMNKLNAKNRSDVANKALKAGIIKSVVIDENDTNISRMRQTGVTLTSIFASIKSREPALDKLTNREKEVLSYISLGETNAAIASKLFIAERTVKSHLSEIYGKLTIRNRTQAALLALLFEEKIKIPEEPIKNNVSPIVDESGEKDIFWNSSGGDGLNEPNMAQYADFERKRIDKDRRHRANIVAAAAERAIRSLVAQGIIDRFNRAGTISASNELLLESLADGGYITPEMASDGKIDLVGLLAKEASKDLNARAILWGPEDSREIALFELRNAAGSFELERLKAS